MCRLASLVGVSAILLCCPCQDALAQSAIEKVERAHRDASVSIAFKGLKGMVTAVAVLPDARLTAATGMSFDMANQ